ncbi:P-loop containing nucleoside triphosphate hydrolase protein [Thelephora ganbajun]|uniref:P-loop containing nucleoside triphosphate hydrolase protein n=1 Tax=Thelephora ganbajun TaxID=370292 RepID=A0ACB6ZIH6_THEGA|nr:P-loop containing nucleoside triphosphate hydrolase protein [Thelephora ganbajun]
MDLTNLSANLTNITNTLTEKPSIANLATVLLSFTGFQNWVKLFLIGGVFETCRRVVFRAWDTIVDSVWITVDLEDGDDSYDWMMVWLSQHPSWLKARKLATSTSSFGLEDPPDFFGTAKNDREVRFIVAYDYNSTFWHKRRYVKVMRSKAEGLSYHSTRSLHLSILGGNHQTVQDILAEARVCWQKAREEQISVYASDVRNEWRLITSRPKRPLKSIILDVGVKEAILEDALDFLDSKEWYSERGIPFRRGYLLYGAPGSGKTSLIQSIAGELNLDVYIISLSRAGLDDNSLQELIADLPEHCIALMEDIDAAFHRTLSRDLPDEGEESKELRGSNPNPSAIPQERTSRISLSGLLNALDGVGAQEGRLLFATTNRYEALDAALRRPGRMDVHVEFKLASRYQIGELFKRFYLPTPRTSSTQRSSSKDTTTSKEDDDDRKTSDSGYGTPVNAETEKLIDVELPSEVRDQSLAAITRRRKRDVKISLEELDVLVERFRESILEGEFSMAALQGYLLMHKNQPHRAAECAGKWVEEEMAKREAKRSSEKKDL